MPKIEVEINQAMYETLKGIAGKLGLPVETLVQQEIDEALANADCWIQRAEMII